MPESDDFRWQQRRMNANRSDADSRDRAVDCMRWKGAVKRLMCMYQPTPRNRAAWTVRPPPSASHTLRQFHSAPAVPAEPTVYFVLARQDTVR